MVRKLRRVPAFSSRRDATAFCKQRRSSMSYFNIGTPSLLLLSKEVHHEALIELRRLPLVQDETDTEHLFDIALTKFDLLPVTTYNRIEYLHFKAPTLVEIMHITESVLHSNGVYDSIPKHATGKTGREDMASVIKLSFETSRQKPTILDLTDTEVVRALVQASLMNDFNYRTGLHMKRDARQYREYAIGQIRRFKGCIERFGKPCPSYSLISDTEVVSNEADRTRWNEELEYELEAEQRGVITADTEA